MNIDDVDDVVAVDEVVVLDNVVVVDEVVDDEAASTLNTHRTKF